MDVFTPEKRSEVMARIRGRDTKPENLTTDFTDYADFWNSSVANRHKRFPSLELIVFSLSNPSVESVKSVVSLTESESKLPRVGTLHACPSSSPALALPPASE